MDYTFVGPKITFCFPDDILILSKSSEEDHLNLVTDCLTKLDADEFRVNLNQNFTLSNPKVLWLGYIITQSGISPLESKTSAILELNPLKKLCSSLCCLHYLFFSQLSST